MQDALPDRGALQSTSGQDVQDPVGRGQYLAQTRVAAPFEGDEIANTRRFRQPLNLSQPISHRADEAEALDGAHLLQIIDQGGEAGNGHLRRSFWSVDYGF